MSVSYAPTKLRLPIGFEHLLEALAKEVLREQPNDIIQFAAEYFRKKLILRDEGALDDTASAEKSTVVANGKAQAEPSEPQKVINPIAGQADGSVPEVNDAAVTVQVQTPADADSENVQEGSQQQVNESETKSVDVTSNVVADIDVDDPELNKAASVIQANFRTYLSKRANEEGRPESKTEPLEAGSDAEPQEATELNEKTEAISLSEAHEGEPEIEDKVDPEMTITHSGSQGDVIQEDLSGTKPQPLPDEEQQVEETEKESSKTSEPPPPTLDQQVEEAEESPKDTDLQSPAQHEEQQIDGIEGDGPKDTDLQSPAHDKEQQVEGIEGDGPEETEPQPRQDESEPLPEESRKEDGSSELASTLQSQDVARSEIPEGVPVEDQKIEPAGGDEQGATENVEVVDVTKETESANEPASEARDEAVATT